MWQPNTSQWWLLVVCSVLIVGAWPPRDGKSLAAKFVNWAVDPRNELPTLPDQLALGAGDDPDAVNARDMQVQQYDALYLKGGWTRKRLELKVAGEFTIRPSHNAELRADIDGIIQEIDKSPGTQNAGQNVIAKLQALGVKEKK